MSTEQWPIVVTIALYFDSEPTIETMSEVAQWKSRAEDLTALHHFKDLQRIASHAVKTGPVQVEDEEENHHD